MNVWDFQTLPKVIWEVDEAQNAIFVNSDIFHFKLFTIYWLISFCIKNINLKNVMKLSGKCECLKFPLKKKGLNGIILIISHTILLKICSRCNNLAGDYSLQNS